MTNVDISGYTKRIVQYFYDRDTIDDEGLDQPVWCLGQRYEVNACESAISSAVDSHLCPTEKDDASIQSHSTEATSFAQLGTRISTRILKQRKSHCWPESFLDDFDSRIWLTYRSDFPPIARSHNGSAASTMTFAVRFRNITNPAGFTSDTGFGCMIRSGQSLLANAMLIASFGRAWRRSNLTNRENTILSLFADDPKAPFSIHKFVEHGALACGKNPGEWFGPSATASCIQNLNNRYSSPTLRVYVTGDGADVYEDSLMATAKTDTSSFTCTLILIGTRLGINQVTPAYYDGLMSLLKMPQSLGIAGGRPSASHYFVGCQATNLLYLDPHQTRIALPLHSNANDMTQEEIDSCHSRHPQSIAVKEMDPSMLIGFLIRDEDDWRQWRKALDSSPGKAIIHVADTSPPLSMGRERSSALEEVESLSDGNDDDEDVVLVET